MAEELEIHHINHDEENEVLSMLKIIFHKWPVIEVESPLEYWRWKFQGNPVKTRNFLVAKTGNKLIGVFGFYSGLLKIKNRVFLSNTGVDVGVHPDYRGKGVYSTLRKTANKVRVEEGYEFSFGIETNPILIKAHEKRGDQGKFPFVVREDFKIFDIDRYYSSNKSFNAKIRIIGFKLFELLTLLKNLVNRPPIIKGVDIYESRDNAGMDVFLEKINSEHEFIFKKTLEWFDWRYYDPRGGKYTVKKAEKNGEIIGYIVLSGRTERESSVGYIVELLVLPEYSEIQDLLISEAISYFREKQINRINFCAVSGKDTEKVLKRHMFLEGNPLYLTFTLDDNNLNLLNWAPFDVNRTHFCYGDFDYI